MANIVGYFMESGIYFQGKEQPPRKTEIILIEGNIEDYSDNDDVSVLSIEENWYTIKKKNIILESH